MTDAFQSCGSYGLAEWNADPGIVTMSDGSKVWVLPGDTIEYHDTETGMVVLSIRSERYVSEQANA